MEAKKRTVSKRVTTVLMLALAAALSLSLVACGKSDQDVIRDGITAEFESIKNLTNKDLFDGFTQGAGDLSTYGIDNEEFLRAWLSDFDYSVDNVSVNGNNATVTVTVTCKLMADFMDAAMEEAEDLSERAGDMTQKELNQEVGKLLMKAITNMSAKTTKITLSYVKDGNVWKPGPNFDSELAPGFIGKMSL